MNREGIAENALKQIKEKNYTFGLRGKTILYGIGFYSKVPTIVSDVVFLD